MLNLQDMNRTHTYRVAGHCFSLNLPDSQKLWDAIEPQYKPFEIADDDCGERIFTLELTDELTEGPRKCLYDMPTEDGETVVKLFSVEDGLLFETYIDHNHPLCATLWTSPDFKTAKLKLETRRVSDALFGINNAAMLLFAFATAPLGTLEMHASVIGNFGHAYLFLGVSGTGKSTHSRMWLNSVEGSELMNDDNPVVRVMPDGQVIAFGSPWSGKTPCYRNVSAPVGAFVQIRQCPENRIRRQNVLEAYASLFSSISGIKDDNSKMSDDLNATMDKVLRAVPCYLLDCLPDAAAAQLCSDTVKPRG